MRSIINTQQPYIILVMFCQLTGIGEAPDSRAHFTDRLHQRRIAGSRTLHVASIAALLRLYTGDNKYEGNVLPTLTPIIWQHSKGT